MTKKQNTLLFMLAGTVVSIIITVLLLIAILLICAKFFPNTISTMSPFIFTLSVLLGMLIYNKLVTFVVEKFNLEDKIEPLFKPRKKKIKKDN